MKTSDDAEDNPEERAKKEEERAKKEVDNFLRSLEAKKSKSKSVEEKGMSINFTDAVDDKRGSEVVARLPLSKDDKEIVITTKTSEIQVNEQGQMMADALTLLEPHVFKRLKASAQDELLEKARQDLMHLGVACSVSESAFSMIAEALKDIPPSSVPVKTRELLENAAKLASHAVTLMHQSALVAINGEAQLGSDDIEEENKALEKAMAGLWVMAGKPRSKP